LDIEKNTKLPFICINNPIIKGTTNIAAAFNLILPSSCDFIKHVNIASARQISESDTIDPNGIRFGIKTKYIHKNNDVKKEIPRSLNNDSILFMQKTNMKFRKEKHNTIKYIMFL
jgi:hypothetical protein